VTGATGMIGTALIEKCLNKGIKVTAVVRPQSQNIGRLSLKSEFLNIVECDISEYKKLPGLITKEADTFYHFAWSFSGRDRNESIKQQYENIGYTLDAIDVAKELGCRKFIGAGSQAEYGYLGTTLINEETPANPDTPYGIAKYSAGLFSMIKCKKMFIDCIWGRVFSVYGRYDSPDSLISSIFRSITEGQ